MHEYTKLATIKCNNKIFDIFVGSDHRKVFLEIKDNKYQYVKLKDFMYLDNIYNKQDKDIYCAPKYKFIPNVLVGAAGLVCLTAIAKFRPDEFSFCNDYKNAVLIKLSTELDDIKDMDKYNVPSVSFDDVRKTLEENKNIPDKYRQYIEMYIDALEQRLPLVDLRMFNENLGKLSFEIFDNDVLDKDKRDGYTDFKVDKVVIGLKKEYSSLEREKIVIYHELTHVLRRGYIVSPANEVLDVNFISDYNYGRQIYESMTDICADYLFRDDYETYFDLEYRNPYSYKKAEFVYQMLKLFKDKYTFYDYFNYDISKFYELLEEYDLSSIIDSYDVYNSSVENNIVIDDSLIKESEKKLIMLRYQQMVNQGYEYNYISQWLSHYNQVLGKEFYHQRFINDFVYDKNGESSFITIEANDKTYNFANSKFTLYYNGEVVYNKSTYEKNGEEIICNNIYITVIDNGGLQYKIVKVEDGNLVDLITAEKYNMDCDLIHITDVFETVEYNYDINLNTFFDSDLVKFKTEWIVEKIKSNKHNK